jgi:glucose-1-phosphate cytidylyltransferase
MKVVILAGGYGTRIMEESALRPKPMIEIGGKPLLWHIMKLYSQHNINDFIICCGYKGYYIKEYFANYFLHMSDVTINIATDEIEVHRKRSEPWKITMIDTGLQTMTGGRLLHIKDHIGDEPFCMTYGDGLSDVDITALIQSHHDSKKLATVTAVQPKGRFGAINFTDNQVISFEEKPKGDGAWINGGFFVLDPKIFSCIEDENTVWEQQPLEHLASTGQLSAYRHTGFWMAMDTLRDKNHLEDLWARGDAPWQTWK